MTWQIYGLEKKIVKMLTVFYLSRDNSVLGKFKVDSPKIYYNGKSRHLHSCSFIFCLNCFKSSRT